METTGPYPLCQPVDQFIHCRLRNQFTMQLFSHFETSPSDTSNGTPWPHSKSPNGPDGNQCATLLTVWTASPSLSLRSPTALSERREASDALGVAVNSVTTRADCYGQPTFRAPRRPVALSKSQHPNPGHAYRGSGPHKRRIPTSMAQRLLWICSAWAWSAPGSISASAGVLPLEGGNLTYPALTAAEITTARQAIGNAVPVRAAPHAAAPIIARVSQARGGGR